MLALNVQDRLSTFEQRGKSPYLDTDQAAEFLGVSPRTLQKFRVCGGGPRYRKWGHRMVRYLLEDLVEWAESPERASTSQGT